MLGLLLLAPSHVPGFGCEGNCCHPKYDVANVDSPDDAISQAFYLKNDGGLELERADFLRDMEAGPGQLVYVDAVFRDEVDRDQYDLYIGCGGCAPGDNFSLSSPLPFEGYGRGRLEPFTQHAYRSFFVGDWRTFNTSVLADCASEHWSIRLRRRDDATVDIFWSAVVGRREWFSVIDLLEYPLYVLRNHGSAWNEQASSFPLLAVLSFAIVFLVLLYSYGGLYMCQGTTTMYAQQNSDRQPYFVLQQRDVVFMIRSVMYFVAAVAIAADVLESLYHVLYALGQVDAAAQQVWTYLLLVLLFGKLVPLLLLAWIWDSMRRWTVFEWLGCGGCCDGCYVWCLRIDHPVFAHVGWAPLEVLTGLSFFFLFGLGFYVAPTAITVAGIVRLSEFQYLINSRAYAQIRATQADRRAARGVPVGLPEKPEKPERQRLLAAPDQPDQPEEPPPPYPGGGERLYPPTLAFGASFLYPALFLRGRARLSPV
tara:strand:+ start:18720 stop:20165 length:1446 start_codon:yes stop_codon:yes gene_type:complete